MESPPHESNNTRIVGNNSDTYTDNNKHRQNYDAMVSQSFSHGLSSLCVPHYCLGRNDNVNDLSKPQDSIHTYYISYDRFPPKDPKLSISSPQLSAKTLELNPTKQQSHPSYQKKEAVGQEALERNLKLMKKTNRLSKVTLNSENKGIPYTVYVPVTLILKIYIVFWDICKDIKKIKNISKIGIISKEEIGYCRSNILELKEEMEVIHDSLKAKKSCLEGCYGYKDLKVSCVLRKESFMAEKYINEVDDRIFKTIERITHFANCIENIERKKTRELIYLWKSSKIALFALFKMVGNDSIKLKKKMELSRATT